MRLPFARPLASSLALGAALAALYPARAEAYDVLAKPCAAEPLTCGTGSIAFSEVNALPIQFNFDTGWVPAGSPVQVHVFANVWANTHVSLTGALQTSWPAAMTLTAPGDKTDGVSTKGGDFGFHYGADFGAQGMVSISIAGVSYNWEGNLPFVPQFDFEVEADQGFDAWGYAPGVTVSSTTMPQQLASIDVSDLIGVSIPGVDAGFALDVAIGLNATYITEQIVIDTTNGELVAGGPITSATGQSSTPFPGGGNIELDVHPEGTVDYNGVVHIIPTFWVSLLGDEWQIPVVDIPISFPITQDQWSFTPLRVHVPVPDLALSVQELDFGDVTVGDKSALTYQLWNAGEALASTSMTTSDALDFPLLDESVIIDPTKTYQAGVEFIPQKRGPFTGQITVASNDPKTPVQLILLKGVGVEELVVPLPPPPESGESVDQPSGCACRTAGHAGGQDGGRSTGAAGMALMAAMALVRRARARARRKGTPAG
jgi:hypothetical protein